MGRRRGIYLTKTTCIFPCGILRVVSRQLFGRPSGEWGGGCGELTRAAWGKGWINTANVQTTAILSARNIFGKKSYFLNQRILSLTPHQWNCCGRSKKIPNPNRNAEVRFSFKILDPRSFIMTIFLCKIQNLYFFDPSFCFEKRVLRFFESLGFHEIWRFDFSWPMQFFRFI